MMKTALPIDDSDRKNLLFDSNVLKDLLSGSKDNKKKSTSGNKVSKQSKYSIDVIESILKEETAGGGSGSVYSMKIKKTKKAGIRKRKQARNQRSFNKLALFDKFATSRAVDRARQQRLAYNNVYEYATLQDIPTRYVDFVERQYTRLRNSIDATIDKVVEGHEQLCGDSGSGIVSTDDITLLLSFAGVPVDESLMQQFAPHTTSYDPNSKNDGNPQQSSDSFQMKLVAFLAVLRSHLTLKTITLCLGTMQGFTRQQHQRQLPHEQPRFPDEVEMTGGADFDRDSVFHDSVTGDVGRNGADSTMKMMTVGTADFNTSGNNTDMFVSSSSVLRPASDPRDGQQKRGNQFPAIQHSHSQTYFGSDVGNGNGTGNAFGDSQFNASTLPPLRLAKNVSTGIVGPQKHKRKLLAKAGFDESLTRGTPRILHSTTNAGPVDINALRHELQLAQEGVRQLGRMVDTNIAWVQNNCELPAHMTANFSSRTKQKCRAMAAERVFTVYCHHGKVTLLWAMQRWRTAARYIELHSVARRYAKIKAVDILTNTLYEALTRQFLRGWIPLVENYRRGKLLEQHAATCQIQRVIRGFLGRVRFARVKAAIKVVVIQSMFRRVKARQVAADKRRLMAAKTLHKQKVDAVSKLQQWVRGLLQIRAAKAEANRRRKLKAAVNIQKVARGKVGRNIVDKKKKKNAVAAAKAIKQPSPAKTHSPAKGDLDSVARLVEQSKSPEQHVQAAMPAVEPSLLEKLAAMEAEVLTGSSNAKTTEKETSNQAGARSIGKVRNTEVVSPSKKGVSRATVNNRHQANNRVSPTKATSNITSPNSRKTTVARSKLHQTHNDDAQSTSSPTAAISQAPSLPLEIDTSHRPTIGDATLRTHSQTPSQSPSRSVSRPPSRPASRPSSRPTSSSGAAATAHSPAQLSARRSSKALLSSRPPSAQRAARSPSSHSLASEEGKSSGHGRSHEEQRVQSAGLTRLETVRSSDSPRPSSKGPAQDVSAELSSPAAVTAAALVAAVVAAGTSEKTTPKARKSTARGSFSGASPKVVDKTTPSSSARRATRRSLTNDELSAPRQAVAQQQSKQSNSRLRRGSFNSDNRSVSRDASGDSNDDYVSRARSNSRESESAASSSSPDKPSSRLSVRTKAATPTQAECRATIAKGAAAAHIQKIARGKKARSELQKKKKKTKGKSHQTDSDSESSVQSAGSKRTKEATAIEQEPVPDQQDNMSAIDEETDSKIASLDTSIRPKSRADIQSSMRLRSPNGPLSPGLSASSGLRLDTTAAVIQREDADQDARDRTHSVEDPDQFSPENNALVTVAQQSRDGRSSVVVTDKRPRSCSPSLSAMRAVLNSPLLKPFTPTALFKSASDWLTGANSPDKKKKDSNKPAIMNGETAVDQASGEASGPPAANSNENGPTADKLSEPKEPAAVTSSVVDGTVVPAPAAITAEGVLACEGIDADGDFLSLPITHDHSLADIDGAEFGKDNNLPVGSRASSAVASRGGSADSSRGAAKRKSQSSTSASTAATTKEGKDAKDGTRSKRVANSASTTTASTLHLPKGGENKEKHSVRGQKKADDKSRNTVVKTKSANKPVGGKAATIITDSPSHSKTEGGGAEKAPVAAPQATVSIEAVHRIQRMARRCLAAMRVNRQRAAVQAAQEEMRQMFDFYATTIQRTARGKQGRKRFNMRKGFAMEELRDKQLRGAIRIQARTRGMRDRQRVAAVRDQLKKERDHILWLKSFQKQEKDKVRAKEIEVEVKEEQREQGDTPASQTPLKSPAVSSPAQRSGKSKKHKKASPARNSSVSAHVAESPRGDVAQSIVETPRKDNTAAAVDDSASTAVVVAPAVESAVAVSDAKILEIEEKIRRLELIERQVQEREAAMAAQEKKAREQQEAIDAALALMDRRAKEDERERAQREQLLALAQGNISHRSEFSAKYSARISARRQPTSARSHSGPPTARSARGGAGIPPDAPRLWHNGEEWCQLWDPEEASYYWYCERTQMSQWETPGGDFNDAEGSSTRGGSDYYDSGTDSGYVSEGAMTDYSTDQYSDYGDSAYSDSEYGDSASGAPEWQEYWDEQAQAKYWYNYNTGEASWTRPNTVAVGDTGTGRSMVPYGGGNTGGIASQQRSLQNSARSSANAYSSTASNSQQAAMVVAADNPADWASFLDEDTGQEYWYNSKTGQSSWV